MNITCFIGIKFYVDVYISYKANKIVHDPQNISKSCNKKRFPLNKSWLKSCKTWNYKVHSTCKPRLWILRSNPTSGLKVKWARASRLRHLHVSPFSSGLTHQHATWTYSLCRFWRSKSWYSTITMFLPLRPLAPICFYNNAPLLLHMSTTVPLYPNMFPWLCSSAIFPLFLGHP